jgi:hypothetical protein
MGIKSVLKDQLKVLLVIFDIIDMQRDGVDEIEKEIFYG